MYLVLGIAAAGAAAVLIYNHYKDLRPDMATSSTRRAQQLAAVVLVLSRAVEGIVEALSYVPASAFATQGIPRGLADMWEDGEYS